MIWLTNAQISAAVVSNVAIRIAKVSVLTSSSLMMSPSGVLACRNLENKGCQRFHQWIVLLHRPSDKTVLVLRLRSPQYILKLSVSILELLSE